MKHADCSRWCSGVNPHNLAGLSEIAGVTLPEELIALQDFAVKARDSPEASPLPASREHLLSLVQHLHAEVEAAIKGRERKGPLGDA